MKILPFGDGGGARVSTSPASGKAPTVASGKKPRDARDKPNAVRTKLPSPFPEHTSTADIIDDLKDNRYDYVGESWFTIKRLPDFVADCIRRGQAEFSRQTKNSVPFAAVLSSALHLGVLAMINNPHVQRYRDLLGEFASLRDVDSDELDEMRDLFYKVKLTAPSNLGGANDRNDKLSDTIMIELSSLATDIGMYKTDVAVVAIVAALADGGQQFVLKGHAEAMRTAVDKFYRRMKLRAGIGRQLIDYLKNGNGKDDQGKDKDR